MNPTPVALLNTYRRPSQSIGPVGGHPRPLPRPLPPSPLSAAHGRVPPGDPAGTLYYVITGSVSIITEEDDGRELVLGYFGTGEFVGEMGLFIESDRREVILRTRTQCELAEISYERLYQLFEGPLHRRRDRRSCTRSARSCRGACSTPAARPAAWPSSTSPTASSAPCTT